MQEPLVQLEGGGVTEPLGLDNWTPSTAQRRVRDSVAAMFGVTPTELIGRGRRQPLVHYRQIAMWVIRECFPTLSYPMIGRLFGARDHSTILHGIRSVNERRERDESLKALTNTIRDGFGVMRAGYDVGPENLERVRMLCEQVAGEINADRPVPEEMAGVALPSPELKARNDFSDDVFRSTLSGSKMVREGSAKLAKALEREGMVCR